MKSLAALSLPIVFFLGLLTGRGTLTPPRVKPEVTPPLPAPARVEPAPAPVAPDQRHEIERLRAEIVVLKKPVAPKPADKSVRAAELYELFRRNMNKEAAPEDRMEVIKALGELEPSMAAWFVEKYRKAESREDRECAFVMISLSGGPDASRFVVEALRDPAFDENQRRQLIRSLAGLDDMPVRCTAEESLTRLGVEWTRSDQPDLRAAAAGILGLGGVPEAAATLQSFIEADRSE